MKCKMLLFVASLISSAVGFTASLDITKDARQSLHLDWLDKKVSPGQNFYVYANGNWQKNNPIPPAYAAWGNFHILRHNVLERLHHMLVQTAEKKNLKVGSIQQQMGDFYYSGMDEKSINEAGVSPLKPELEQIEAIKSFEDLQHAVVHLHKIGVNVLFDFGSMQDYKNSDVMIAAAFQGGLGLPERDYYLNPAPEFKKIRQAYIQHIATMFKLLNHSQEKSLENARLVMNIETQLAKASLPIAKTRHPEAIYHIKTLAELENITPDYSWPLYLKQQGLSQLKTLNLATPDFFKAMNSLLTTTPLWQWKIYLRWHLINRFAAFLSKPFVDQHFQMNSILSGTEKIRPRWEQVVNTENSALGNALGKMYVEKYFSLEDKKQVENILKNIRSVFKEDLKTLSWMSPENRKKALKKLHLMKERIGYPTTWWDYSSLQIDRGPYVLNIIHANAFLIKRDLNKIGQPVDKSEWQMTPQTVNAYYDVSLNNINIPAGILQPPFYDPKAPAAVNYGAIGFVMGHEITHGFDDQGAKFDGHGNLKNWWSANDLQRFKKATQCLADQFSKYVVNGHQHLNGPLVVGEATADLGGLTLAYRAFLKSKDYQNAQTIAGLSPAQQFFLSNAHVWALNIRPQQLQNRIMTDPHPPSMYRVNGSYANMPQFQAAFNLDDNSPMVKKNRCVIW